MLSILLDKHAHKKGVLERIENKVLLIRLFLKSEWTGFFFCVPWLKKVFPIWYESISCRIGKITPHPTQREEINETNKFNEY